MRAIPSSFAAYQYTASKEPMVVVEIAFDAAGTDLVYFTSHSDTPLPGGAVNVAGCVKKVSSTSQSVEPDQARSTIGSINIELIDKAGAVSTLFKARDDAGKGIRYKRLRVYQGFRGMDWAALSSNLIQTQIVDNLGVPDGGVYKIACADVQRTARNDIFNLATTSLSASVAADQMLIPVYSVTDFARVAHGASYTDAPSAEVGYIKIEDEVIRWTGTTTDGTLGLCFVVGARGALGTRAADHQVDTSASTDRKTEVKEFIYLELPAIKLAYALLTGNLYGQAGKRLPDGWHLNIPGAYIRTSDFVNIGADLWNTATDDGLIVRFAGEEKQDGKQFIEQQLCLLTSTFMPVYSNGEWGLRRFTSILHEAPHVFELNDDNVVKYGELSIDLRSVYNVLSLQWNYDHLQDKLTRQKILVDQLSIDKFGNTATKELKFNGLHGSRHTTTTIESLFDRLRDRYAGPPHRLPVRCLPYLNFLEVGDIVRVRTSGYRDYLRADQKLDRAMEVQRVSVDWMTGQVDLELFGSTHSASPIAPANPGNGNPDATNSVLPDAFYTGSGTNITAMGAAITTTLTSGVRHITGGSGIVGSDALGATRIYCNGDLELNSGVTLNFTKNVVLVVKGHLQINGVLNGIGGGKAGAAASSAGSYEAHNSGVAGYLGPTLSAGGFADRYVRVSGPSNNQTWLDSVPGYQVNGAVSVVPRFELQYVGGQLLGLPTDLQGTSGSSGHNTDYDPNGLTFIAGGAGGNGGAGILIIARGIDFGAAGQIRTNGANGSAGAGPTADCYAGAGAGGAPGAVIMLLDGINSSIPDLSHVEAKWGSSPLPVGVKALDKPSIMVKTTSSVAIDPPYYAHYTGYGATPPDMSGYGGACRLQYIPPINVPTQDVPATASKPLLISLTAFPNTPRTLSGDQTSIEVTVTPPSDANYDYANIFFIKDGGALTYTGAAGDEWVFVVPSDGATYEVRAYAVSIGGKQSDEYVKANITLSNTAAAALATVTGLALEQSFVGRSAKLKWNAVDGAETYAVAIYAGSPTQTLRRTIDVGNALRFEYTFEDAVADAGPWRDIQFQVRGKSPVRTSGSWAVTNASNPQMTVPTGIQIGTIARTFTIAVAKPTATDYAGTIFAMSGTSGFDQNNTANWIYDGPDILVTRQNVSPGTYYLRAAHYDTFGKDSLVWCAEQSVTIVDTSINGGIPQVANAATIHTLAGPEYWAVYSLADEHIWIWDGSSNYLNTADGANFIANSIGANKLAVTMLSAISANLGIVNAGLFRTDSGSGFRVEIEGGAALPFWIGSNSKTIGNAKMYVDLSGNLVANGLSIVAASGYANLSDRPADSSIYNSYITVGGTNLIRLPDTTRGWTFYNGAWVNIGSSASLSQKQINLPPHASAYVEADSSIMSLKQGVDYTISFYAWASANGTAFHFDLFPDTLPEPAPPTLTTTRTKYSFVVNSSHADMLSCKLRFFHGPGDANATTATIYVEDVVLEEGNKASTWSMSPLDYFQQNSDSGALGFNGDFNNWSGSYPDGWSVWSGAAPTKDSVNTRGGRNSPRWDGISTDTGMVRNYNFGSTTPLAPGSFLSGSIDINLVARTSGLPGLYIVLWADSALTVGRLTYVTPATTVGAWQRIPWTARALAGESIYGISVYVMGSWSGMPAGNFNGSVIFAGLDFDILTADQSLLNGLQQGVTITSGGINLNSGGAVYGGTSDPGAGAGVYLGWHSGAYHLLAGDYSAEKYLHFDGNNFILGKNVKFLGGPSFTDTAEITAHLTKHILPEMWSTIVAGGGSVSVSSSTSYSGLQLVPANANGTVAYATHVLSTYSLGSPSWTVPRTWMLRAAMAISGSNTNTRQSIGMGNVDAFNANAGTSFASGCGFGRDGTQAYVWWQHNSSFNRQAITADGNMHIYRIDWDGASVAKFYVDGTLVYTATGLTLQYNADIAIGGEVSCYGAPGVTPGQITIGECKFIQKS